ncbi:MAG: gamma carbonic anhydrase family protein [Bacteroidales bacterium]|nr:gamma carbonic anhydrase family protein [Bacteroidales bacterium]
MGIIKAVRGFTPKLGNNCYIADNAVIVGDVIAGNDCSFWFGSVTRGDVNAIRIGNNVNIQDGAVLHTLYQKSTIDIGDNVSIAHNAVVHGAKIHKNVLIGIGAVILDYAEIGENSIIAAGAIVLSNSKVAPGSIYAGNPAKRIKDVDPAQAKSMIEGISSNYKMYASWFQ